MIVLSSKKSYSRWCLKSQTSHQKILSFHIYYYNNSHHSLRFYNGICYNVHLRFYFGFGLSCLSHPYPTILPRKKDSNQ